MKAQRLALLLILTVGVMTCDEQPSWGFGRPVSASNIFLKASRPNSWASSSDDCVADAPIITSTASTFTPSVVTVAAAPEAPRAVQWNQAPSVSVDGGSGAWSWNVVPAKNPTAQVIVTPAPAAPAPVDASWTWNVVPAKNPTAEVIVTPVPAPAPAPTAGITIRIQETPIVVYGEPDNFGCAEWRNGVCVKCSYRFITRARTCEPVNPLCKTWDNTGKCTSCYNGYTICAEGCVPDTTAYSAPLCAAYDGTRCVKCATGAWWNNGVCTQANPNCKTFDANNGWCTACYAGYSLQNGQCVLIPITNEPTVPSDLLCARWNGAVCTQCAVNAYSRNGVCTQVNPLCKTFDNGNGWCLSCYKGYNLNGGNCILAGPTDDSTGPVGPTDLLCAKWSAGVCTACAKGAFFRSGVCVASDPLCKTFNDANGACTSCYGGYYLDAGQCLRSPVVPDGNPVPADALCAKWSNGVCVQCSRSAYFRNGVCTQSDPLCKTFDQSNGNCLSCYAGYVLNGGNCVRAPDSQAEGPSDLLCAKWNGNVCVSCATAAYFKNGICVASDPLCKTFDSSNGNCLTCYAGYDLYQGKCWKSAVTADSTGPSDALCAKWNGNVCAVCARSAYFKNGVCVASDPLCKTFDSVNGWCTSCYSGYNLNNGRCVLAEAAPASGPSDILCAKWSNGACVSCATAAYFRNGICVASDPLCRTFDSSNGWCLSCYSGYVLSAGKCVVAPDANLQGPTGPTDLLCSRWNAGVCVSCATAAYFSNGVCVASDPLCKTFDNTNGWCRSCYVGYVLSGGKCVKAPDAAPEGPSDLLCAKWFNGVCTQCSRWAYPKNGVCVQANPQCKTFDNTNGWCTSCYAGYDLTNGDCVAQIPVQQAGPVGPSGPQLPANFDIYCKTYSRGICQACFFGYKLTNGSCVENFAECKAIHCP